MIEKPTDEEFLTWQKQREMFYRSIAVQIPEIVNSKPGITFEQLADELKVHVEDICSIVVSRLNVDTVPITLRHLEGKRVMYDGTIEEY